MTTEEHIEELGRIAAGIEDRERPAGSPGAKAPPQERKPDPLIVSINAPHTVAVNGNAVAINIAKGPEAGTGTASSALGPIVLTLSKNGIPTDYNINGVEVV